MPKPNQTPADVLKSLLGKYKISNMSLSKQINLSPSMVNQLVSGQSRFTVPAVLRLSKFFGTSPAFWLDLQRKTLLAEANSDKKLQGILKRISKVKKPEAAGNKPGVAKGKSLSVKRKKAAKVPGSKPASRLKVKK